MIAVQPVGDLQPSGAVISPMAAAVFAQMLARPLRLRIAASSGIHPDNAAELREMYAELDRVGRVWMASRPRKSAGCATEINAGSVADMEINTEKAAELLRLTDARIRQLLRDGSLPGRKVGRRWVVMRSAAIAYRVLRKAAA